MQRLSHRRAFLLPGIVVGCAAVAFVASSSRASVYRATTKLVVVRGATTSGSTSPTVATLRNLVRSNVVAANVVQSLHLGLSPAGLLEKISTRADARASVVDLSVDDHDPTRAVQITQEVAVVLARLLQARFGAGVSAQAFDPPHILPGRISPRPVRDGALGAVVGLMLSLGALVFLERPARARWQLEIEAPVGSVNGAGEEAAAAARTIRRLSAQVAALEKLLRSRERAVEHLRVAVGRLEALPGEEHSVPKSSVEQEQSSEPTSVPAPPVPTLPDAPEPEAQAPPVVLAVPELPAPAEAEEAPDELAADIPRRSTTLVFEPMPGSFSLDALQDAAARYQDAPQADVWTVYATFLREHADLHGVLPPFFEELVWEVYGDLIQRVCTAD